MLISSIIENTGMEWNEMKLNKKELSNEKERKLETLYQFTGIAQGDTKNKTIQELKKSKKEKYK